MSVYTICHRDQMKSTDQEVNLAKSSDQRVVQTVLEEQPAFIRLFDRIFSDQGPFMSEIKRSR